MHAPLHWFVLVLTLLVTLAVGVCVHELLHVAPLWFTDADYAITVLPSDDSRPSNPSLAGWTTLGHAFAGSLVRVEITHLPASTPEWLLRVAALLPLLLALPLLSVAAGVLPDPLAADSPVGMAALVAVTACGLPSPADWAVVWHGSDCYAEA